MCHVEIPYLFNVRYIYIEVYITGLNKNLIALTLEIFYQKTKKVDKLNLNVTSEVLQHLLC